MKKTEIIKEIESGKMSERDLWGIIRSVQHQLERTRMMKGMNDKNWRAKFKSNSLGVG